ncbi:CoB--CoM heterodisulfide reductase iron-sulfur subunit A family protein [Dissulfurirhabdus thermomarina]|uniref:CoB--CoM heterodisulfide reductase iron-sulfur subunit A family protein n=1 Tax=Dissulfurirhabdus thermomarina TaxID=1765737 RepID=A0A6N9TMH8_DISTH|nr:CoB--CoM heterodisulfide reductase iron-sulfur subunit A family protein [Dissulfurirhabdus thermomarina]NDY42248.1 CoB--CoM heterodisulfide reductase iron-sulfur subunit A family protein [Dissulfurirhabdus thermomarina]NMX22979.1 CoB--CoM heterodisulfide reductase iron-sulfur subunit A family protein [Dissulfurirhabdus thermomarina]
MPEQPGKQAESQGRIGVYICHCGGNISDHVDVKRVAEEVAALPGVAVARTNMFMCSDPGQALIQEDIRQGRIDRVVVASCAPSLHELTFRGAIRRAGLNPYLYEHANIREQVSWVHHGEPATRKAAVLIAAAAAKARRLAPLEPIRVEARRAALVIGGGVAGLRAARDLARSGLRVDLVERSPFLGGQAARLDRLAPTGESAAALVQRLAGEVLEDPAITVHSCAEVTGVEGYVGNFRATVTRRPPEPGRNGDRFPAAGTKPGAFVPFAGVLAAPPPAEAAETVVEAGVIVLATGFRPYVPREGEFGYGRHPGVITLPELIRFMAEHPQPDGVLRVGGREIRRAALIHCVGSRQIPGIHEPDADGNLNEHCSRTCCSAALQAACLIRERYPATRVLEYYRDIRTYGRGQEALYERAGRDGVVFFRYEADAPPEVTPAGGDPPLRVRVRDTLTFGEEVEAEVDLVVLAVGMVPGDIGGLVELLKLPVGADRFLQEVHPKLRPVEVAATGILLAGTCQAPMDVSETCAAAQAASVKAAALLHRGYVELDPFVAAVDPARCTGSGACVEACPVEGAVTLEEVEEADGRTVRRAVVNPALCTGCGVCVAACPSRAIDVCGWTLEQYEAMVDAIAAA